MPKLYSPHEVKHLIDSTGYNVAFAYSIRDGSLIFGESHEMIIYEVFKGDWDAALNTPFVYGWVLPDEQEDPGHYEIEFSTDFGRGQSQYPDRSDEELAAEAVKEDIGYENVRVGSFAKQAGQIFMGHKVSCFGYVDGRLFLGTRHHMAIMDFIIKHGYDWPSLIDAEQAWGWIMSLDTAPSISLRFSTDAAAIQRELIPDVQAAFTHVFGKPTDIFNISDPTNSKYAPQLGKDDPESSGYGMKGLEGCVVYDSRSGFMGWVDYDDESKQFPPRPARPEWLPEGLHQVPTTLRHPLYPPKPGDSVPEGEPETQEDQHILIMGLKNGSVFKSSKSYSWNEAQLLWKQLDDLRIKGEVFPTVSWFAVRSIDDPKFINAPSYDIAGIHGVNPYPLHQGQIVGWSTSSPTYTIHDIGEEGVHFADLKGKLLTTSWYSWPHIQSLIDKGTIVPLDENGQKISKISGWDDQVKFVYDTQTEEIKCGEGPHADHWALLAQFDLDEDWIEYYISGQDKSGRFVFGADIDGYLQIYEEPGVTTAKKDAASSAFRRYLHHKTAANGPPYLYHASESRNRESIRLIGLHPIHDQTGYQAVYLSKRPLLGENWDIWKIYTEGLTLESDISTPGYENQWYMCYNVISPDRMRLMEPWELDSQGDIYASMTKNSTYWCEDCGEYHDDDDENYDEGYNEGLTNDAPGDIIEPVSNLGEPENINGWNVYEMQSGEYPSHHAILVDRSHKRMFINYYGHHYPLINELSSKSLLGNVGAYSNPNGHYRLAPSPNEPFAEGWGWHSDEASPDEKEILKQVMKRKHNVENLKDAWETTSHVEPVIEWVDVCDKPVKIAWKALWDRKEDKLTIWNTCGNESHHYAGLQESFPGAMTKTGMLKNKGQFVQSEGKYVTPSYILAPGSLSPEDDKDHVRSLLTKALEEKYKTINKTTNFKKESLNRFMVKENGQVIVGDYDTHYDLIAEHEGSETADHYYNDPTTSEQFPFVGGGYINDSGDIILVHTDGEPDFDPEEIGKTVYQDAHNKGISLNGELIYKDHRQGRNVIHTFDLTEGS